MQCKQKTGKINIPDGKKVAVALTYDCDAQTLWTGSVGRTDQVSLSRGEFGALVGIPRILDMLERKKVKATFFVPGQTADSFPDVICAIRDAGHEIGFHSYAHKYNGTMSYEEEFDDMERALASLAKLDIHPSCYRAPGPDYSPQTLDLLEKFGFKYASNLLGNDIYPYYPQKVTGSAESGNHFGETSPVLELPLGVALDDIIFVEEVPQMSFMPRTILRPTDWHLNRWKTVYDYTAELGGGEFISVNHPQASGHPEFILNMERFIDYCNENDAWFATCRDIYENFVPDTTN